MPDAESPASGTGSVAAVVHLSCSRAVDVAVDSTSTAGDVINAVQAKTPEDPQHGNILLSRGPEKFAATDKVLPESESEPGQAWALANYGHLHSARSPLHHIPTERSGITIPQIQALLGFMQSMVNFWAGTFGAERARPLSFEQFNLYHADYWILRPATAGKGGIGCSYVELVAESAEAQQPTWFVSHAWVEPIVLFLRCLRRHADVRDLKGESVYWVCAYANNQHVEHSSKLYLDVAATAGDVACLVTDGVAGREAKLLPILGLLEKARREEAFPAELLQRGLAVSIELAQASQDQDKIRILNSIACPRAVTRILDELPPENHASYSVVNRALASHFAVSGLYACHAQNRDASALLAALCADTERLTVQLSLTGCKHFRDAEQRALMAHLPTALQSLRLDLGHTGLESFQANEGLCPQLRILQLRFSGPYLREAKGIAPLLGAPTLRDLELWFTSLPLLEDLHFTEALLLAFARSQVPLTSKQALRLGSVNLPHSAGRKLQRHDSELQMWLCIEELGLCGQSKSQRRVARVVRFAGSLHTDSLQCCEDVASWMQQLRTAIESKAFSFTCAAAPVPEPQPVPLRSREVPEKCARKLIGCRGFGMLWAPKLPLLSSDSSVRGGSSKPSARRSTVQMEMHKIHDRDTKMHHMTGYCDEHYFCRLWRGFLDNFQEARRYFELALIFFVQAAADIDSKGLLLLILLSLYPVLVFGLADVSGFSVSSLSALLLALLVASFSYASFRFDQMQRATLELSLSLEGFYSQVLGEDECIRHASLVFGVAGDSYPSVDEVRQERDAKNNKKTNFLRAQQHLPSFQKAVQKVVRAVGAEDMEAQIKCGDESFLVSDGCEGAVDVLHCDIYCNDLRHVRQTWNELSRCFHSEEEPIYIVALRDGFAEEDSQRRCCEVVLGIEGYLATVRLLEKSLAKAEQKLAGLCRVAKKFGLLVESRPRTGGQDRKGQAKAAKSSARRPSVFLTVTLGLVRVTALLCSAYFAAQYFLRHAPPNLRETLPEPLREFLSLHVSMDEEDRSWFDVVSLALPYVVLILVFSGLSAIMKTSFVTGSHDLARCRRQRLKPSQIIFERHFGVHGNCYVIKVALMQVLTVLLQAFGKVQLLGGTVAFGMYQDVPAAQVLKKLFWIFWALLALNSIYPSFLFARPDLRCCRYGAAVMDVVLDLGYSITYLCMVVTAMSELTLETSVSGNFGDAAELGFRNSISPAFAFPADILPYMAVYMSLAHICCACRAVERAKQLGAEGPAQPSEKMAPDMRRSARSGFWL
ncbi:GPR125, partial [Symbiodinium necroappetens]